MTEFVYQPRSEATWRERVAAYDISLSDMPEVSNHEDEGENELETLHQKNRCVCGHLRRDHCIDDPKQHWPDDAGEFGYYFCITTHCQCFLWKEGLSTPCPCAFFRATPAARVKFKRPSANDFTPCARCGHEKGLHCSGSARKKLKPARYQGFSIHGQPFPCRHTALEKRYMCTSTACAEVVRDYGNGLGEFCDCPKFENPLLKRAKKPKVSSVNAQPRAPRRKTQGELFLCK